MKRIAIIGSGGAGKSTLAIKKPRPDITPGCHERIEWSYIKWILDYRREKRPSVMARIEQHSGKRVVILHSPRESQAFP